MLKIYTEDGSVVFEEQGSKIGNVVSAKIVLECFQKDEDNIVFITLTDEPSNIGHSQSNNISFRVDEVEEFNIIGRGGYSILGTGSCPRITYMGQDLSRIQKCTWTMTVDTMISNIVLELVETYHKDSNEL